jgi:transcriptional regulator with XRE-family HTH domain
MIDIDNILSVNNITAEKLSLQVADNVKQRRLEMNLTQAGLAARSGVNINTYRRFESSGEIAFLNLIRIASALEMTDDINRLFSQKKYRSIDEVVSSEKKERKRGKRNE